MPTHRAPIAPWLLGSLPIALALGCGGTDATATERLWVSGVPTTPKTPMTAFLTTRTSDGKYIGAFFQGSMYRGGHDVFQWYSVGDNSARIEFLQDGAAARLRFETCKPSTGFDHCLLVHGDPTDTVKYQSRKRWAVRRPGKKRDVADGLVTEAILELAEDDEDLRAFAGL